MTITLSFNTACLLVCCWAFTVLCAWSWVDHIGKTIQRLTSTLKEEASANRRQLGELTRPLDENLRFQKDERERRRQAGGEVFPEATELLAKVRRQ